MTESYFRKALIIMTALLLLSAASVSAHGLRSNYSVPQGLTLEGYELSDGIYTGTADGFRPGLVVEVTIENSELVEVEVVDHNEVGRQYYQRAINIIPDDIVLQQSTDVDVVSTASLRIPPKYFLLSKL